VCVSIGHSRLWYVYCVCVHVNDTSWRYYVFLITNMILSACVLCTHDTCHKPYSNFKVLVYVMRPCTHNTSWGVDVSRVPNYWCGTPQLVFYAYRTQGASHTLTQDFSLCPVPVYIGYKLRCHEYGCKRTCMLLVYTHIHYHII